MAYLKQNPVQEWISFLIGSEPYRYHCWHRSSEQWYSHGRVYRTFGMINLVVGMFFMITTAIILSTFRSHSLMKSSCYKILFGLGIISWFEVITISIWPAFLLLRGGVFCNYPLLGMIAGRSLTMEWVTGTSMGLFLAFNRVADMTKNKILLKFFDKPVKIGLTFLSILIYSLIFALFTDPCLYNSSRREFSVNPFNEMEPELFSNIFIHYHNIGFIFFLSIISIVVIYKLCTENENCWRGTSDLQRKIMIHSLFITIQYVIPPFVYLIIYLWNTQDSPQCFIDGTHVWFQVTACLNGLVTLIFNRPIRVKFLNRIGLKHYVIQPNRRAAPPSVTRSNV